METLRYKGNLIRAVRGKTLALLVVSCWGTLTIPVWAATGVTLIGWGDNTYGQTNIPPGMTNLVAISAGVYHNLALREDGTLAGWGENTFGQTNIPAGLGNVVMISAGFGHNMVLKDDGTVAAWGDNTYGQTNIPAGLSNVVAVSAGYDHNLVLESDGTVVSWGRNDYGQTNVPADLRNVIGISGGGFHSLALRSDGTMVAWGRNDLGQTNIPPGESNIVAIAAGGYHNLALRSNGSVTAWGYNNAGQSTVPSGLANVVAIEAGSFHSLAIRNNSRITLWGDNSLGQTHVSPLLFGFVALAGGQGHSIALTNSGSVFILTQPKSQAVQAGYTALFNIVALGSAPLSYQWQSGGTNIPGATSSSFVLTNAQPVNAGTYRVIVSNNINAVTSVDCTLTVLTSPPSILVQPAGQTVLSGTNVSFGVVADGSLPMSFQWQLNGTNLPSATNSSLTLTNVQPSNNGNYRVIITNAFGMATSSNAALLAYVLPTILVQPASQTVVSGASVTFTAAADGTPPLSFQWKFDGTNRVGATNSSLTLSDVQSGDAGDYSVVVSNPYGTTNSSAASLAVKSGQVLAWGANGSGQSDVPVWLTNVVAIAGGAEDSVALLADGTVVEWGSDTNVPTDLSNVVAITAGTFRRLALKNDGTVLAWGNNGYDQGPVPDRLTNVTAIAAGYGVHLALKLDGTVVQWGGSWPWQVPDGLSGVTAIATAGASDGDYGMALKQDGTVVVWGAPLYGQDNVPAGLSNVVAISAGLYFGLALKSDGTVVQWGGDTNVPAGLSNVAAISAGAYFNLALKSDGTVVAWGDGSSGQTDVPGGLGNTVAIAAGQYHSLALRSDGLPFVSRQPTSRTAFTGYETTFHAAAAGALPLWYQWQHNGTNISGATNAALSLADAQASDGGNYRLVVSNALGTIVSSNAFLTLIESRPVILTQPVGSNAYVGDRVALETSVLGSGPLTYQWLLNSSNLAGATNSSLVLDYVQPPNAGVYSLTISNPLGTTNSSNVTVTVTVPVCLSPPTGLVGWWAGEDSAADSKGTNHGLLQNGTSFASGKVNRAFSFDGVNDFVTNAVPGFSSILDSYTMEFWAFPTASRESDIEDNNVISGLVNQRYAIFPNNGGAGPVGSGVSVGTNGVSVYEHGAGYLPALLVYDAPIIGWTHIAVVYSNRQPSLYINGNLARVGLTSTRSSCPSTCLGEAGAGYGYYSGLLDEVSMYNRPLSPSEVQGIYQARVQGKCLLAPSIAGQPANRSVPVGANVNFSVDAVGSQPLSYQWTFNGTNISGATNSLLALTNVQLAAAGNYSVLLINTAGSTNSINATLTVVVPSCLPPPAGLVGWWSGEGSAADSVGTNHGVLVNGTGFAAGEVGQALSFDGVDDFVANPLPGLPTVLDSYTMEFWAFPTTGRASTAEATSGTAGIGNQRYAIFPHNAGSPQAGAGVSVGTNGVSVFEHGNSYLAPLLVYNTLIVGWTHIAVVYSNRQPTLYINGDLVRVGLTSSKSSYPSTCLGESGLGYGYYSGFLDEVSIYNRPLSAAEVQSIYNAFNKGKCGGPPVIAVQPADAIVPQGSNATLTVAATGALPLLYQWRMNGTDLSGETNALLTLTNVDVSQVGNYSLSVANFAGSTNSREFTLSLIRPASWAPVPNGLVSWWAAEGNAADSVGTNNGALQGGTLFAAGKTGQAFAFPSGSGYVQVADSVSLAFGANDYSIGLWVKFTSLGGSRAFLAKDQGPGQQNKWIFWLNNGQLQFIIGNGPTQTFLGSSAFSPVTNRWYHLAVTRSGPLFSFYIDGGLNGTGSSAAVVPPISAPLTIGQAETIAFMGGFVDDVVIYNRALSAAELPASPPVITVQPEGQLTPTGIDVTLTASATGATPLFYQWRKNGTNLANATNASLELTNVQVTQSGNYTLLVTNNAGVTISHNAGLAVTPPASCVIVPSGLVGWWAGEGTASDSFYTNHGVATNGVGFGGGVVGQAFSFSGANSVQVPDSSNLNFSANTPMTVEMWVRRTGSQATMHLLGKRNLNCGTLEYQMAMDSAGGLQFGGGSGGVFTGVQLPINVWMHVAATFDGGTFRFYTNGSLAGSGSGNLGPINSAALTIGGSSSCPGFAGQMDEVALYSRALAAEEVQSIYLAGSAGKCLLPPVFTSQPQSQTWPAGMDVTMAGSAIGSAPLSYQWRFNGSNILNATNSIFILSNAQVSQSGNYSLLVSNLAASTNSSNATLIVNPPGSCLAPASGLVGWWDGDLSGADNAGTNHGTLKNGAGFAAGKVGQAFSFNGTSTLEIANASNLHFTANAPLTVEMWVYRTGIQSTMHLLGKRDPGCGAFEYQLAMDAANGLQFGSLAGAVFTHVQLPTNAWMYLAVTYDGSTFAFYTNGALAATGTGSLGTANNSPLTLGASGGCPGFVGLMDEVSLYARALSSAEIRAVFLADSAGKCPIPPTIIVQPQPKAVPAGADVAFLVTAVGKSPINYQWGVSGSNIASATNAFLSLNNVQAADAGNYSVSVTNPAGSTNSSVALLTVNPADPQIILQPLSQRLLAHTNATFSVAARGSDPLGYQWQFNGTNLDGATNATLVLTNLQLTNTGAYQVLISNAIGASNSAVASLLVGQSFVLGWGYNGFGQTNLIPTLIDATAIAAGQNHSLALRSNHTVLAWGNNASGQTNVPAGLNDAVAIAGGGFHSLAARAGGSAIGWGDNSLQQTNVPAGLTTAQTVAGGLYHSLALKNDGKVIAWGNSSGGQTTTPPGLSNVVAIAAGGLHNLALKNDGKVVAWGYNNFGQCNVPANLSNVVAVAAGYYHSLALKSDGKVVAWGYNAYGQSSAPAALNNVVAVAAGYYHNLALKADGTVAAWGDNSQHQTNVPAGLASVVAVAAGGLHSLALQNDGSPFIVRQPWNQTVTAGANATFNVAALGAPSLMYQWQFNGSNMDGATNATLVLTNVPVSAQGAYSVIVSNAYASVASSNATLTVLRATPQFDTSPGAMQYSASGFSFGLMGLSAHGPVIVYVSTNLTDWQPIFTNPPVTGLLQFLDTDATNFPVRFYRAEEQ